MTLELLDLYSCQGGAARGYQMAGLRVTAVDIDHQPRNCADEFVQADALQYLAWNWRRFDAIHASPTCQTRARVTAWRGDRANHPDTLTPTLALLRELPIPYVVENVTEAVADGSMRGDLILCGSMFDLPIRRHRAFETSFPVSAAGLECHHRKTDMAFTHKGERAYADAMGCTWMTNRGGRQAIPPAYTEFIGRQLVEHLRIAA